MYAVDPTVFFSAFCGLSSPDRSELAETLDIISNIFDITFSVYCIVLAAIAFFIVIRSGTRQEKIEQFKKLACAAVAVLLVLVCLFAAVNCGATSKPYPKNDDTTITTTSTTTTTTTSTTVPTTTTTTTAADDITPFSNIRVGGTVSFGEYYIGSSSHTSPLTWRVLDIDRSAGLALLITEQAVDCKSFDSSHSNVPWKNSDLRKWLNNSFYYDAFSDDDRNYIQRSSIYTMDYAKVKYYTDDYVFCLSEAEAYKYFNSDTSRQAAPTPYAVSNGIYEGETTGNCCWWLRSVGYEQNADCVDFWGTIMVGGTNVNSSGKGVRPVIYVYI